MSAGDSRVAYEKYRDAATPGKLFPRKHPLMGPLFQRYDTTSKLLHPSLHSLAHQVTVTTTPGIGVRVDYFQLRDDDPTEPLQTFLWTMDTHFGILRAFERVLRRLVDNDPPKWTIRRDAADAKLGMYKGKLRSVLDAMKKPRKSLLIWTP